MNVELQDSVSDSDEFWSKLRHDLNEAHAGGEFPPGVAGIIVDSNFGDTVWRCWSPSMGAVMDTVS